MRLYNNDAYRDQFVELVYDLLQSDGTNDRANQIIDAFDMAPALEADPLPQNDPLTLEQLREMDGEPVWTVVDNLPKGGYYCLCEKGVILAPSKKRFDCKDIPDWIFLRRKPEEGETWRQ